MFVQLQSFVNGHYVLERFQSGLNPLHSTETTILKVLIDLLLATDSGDSALILLLDLTAAFETVDHSISIS